MKRILSLSLVWFLLLLTPAAGLRAEAASEQYAVAASPSVAFYTAESESAFLFFLPESYYVKIVAEGEPFTRVSYLTDDPPFKKITGYCRTDDLLFVDYVPVRPYLMQEVTLSYALPQTGTLGGGSFSTVERTFVYYGHRYDGVKLYYYVLSGDTFDYVPAESELVYEKNTDYLELTSAEAPSGGGSDDVSAAVIVTVCLACAAAVAIAVFVFRGKKPPVPDDD